MNSTFLLHILISWCIFYIIWTGAKMFLKLRWSMDFSYLAIVIFGAYSAALLNGELGWTMQWAILWAFGISLPFTLLVLYLSKKLEGLYFTIGTLTFYILMYQLALNLESITWGVYGLTSMTRVFTDQLSFR